MTYSSTMSDFHLPTPVSTFFAAKGEDTERAAACFTEDAIVWDNGEDIKLQGTTEIRKWLSGTIAEYKLTTEVVSGEIVNSQFVAGVVVTGDFPGSPYKFEYAFTLHEDKIAELTINPIGSLSS